MKENTTLVLVEDIPAFAERMKSGRAMPCGRNTYALLWSEGVTIYIHKVEPGIQLSRLSGQWGMVLSFDTALSLYPHDLLPSSYVQSLLYRVFAMGFIACSAEDYAFTRCMAKMILHEFRNAYAFRDTMLNNLFKLFALRICQVYDTPSSSDLTAKAALADKFQELLDGSFEKKKMVKEYAEILCVTANYLNNVVRLVSGRAASSHIRERVIQEAKQLTLQGRTMKEIASRLGFADPAHFSKYFKQSCGQRFTEFKCTNKFRMN